MTSHRLIIGGGGSDRSIGGIVECHFHCEGEKADDDDDNDDDDDDDKVRTMINGDSELN